MKISKIFSPICDNHNVEKNQSQKIDPKLGKNVKNLQNLPFLTQSKILKGRGVALNRDLAMIVIKCFFKYFLGQKQSK